MSIICLIEKYKLKIYINLLIENIEICQVTRLSASRKDVRKCTGTCKEAFLFSSMTKNSDHACLCKNILTIFFFRLFCLLIYVDYKVILFTQSQVYFASLMHY